jgi:hypothetical protein
MNQSGSVMQNHEVLKIGAPFITMGGVWVAQKAVATAYRRRTGDEIPMADNLAAPMSRVVFFAAATAVVGAVITVAVNRTIAKVTQNDPSDF